MQIGVVFPQTEIGSDPSEIKDYALAAETLGYDYLLAYEHVLGADPAHYDGGRGFVYTAQDAFHEPFVLFGFLASITRRLSFVTGILILPQRNAIVVAKQAAALDVLSGGRLRLGVGVGWNRPEAEALGSDFSTRGQRMDEQLAVMDALWTQPVVDFKGAYHHIPHLGINPLPVQRPIPVWFGGMADPVLRRMARWGAGWLAPSMSPDKARPVVERLRGYLQDEGRDPDSFGIDVRVTMSRLPRDAWGDYVDGWRELGATHVCLNAMNTGRTTLEAHLDALREFKHFLDA